MPGAFQFNNAAIAVTLFLLWHQHELPRRAAGPDRSRDTRWPARRAMARPLEIIQQNPLTVIDVGHTPDGIRQSLASLMAIHGAEGWILVTGASGDKKADEIVGALAPSFDTIICTAAHHKGADAAISPPPPRAPIPQRNSCRRDDRGRGARWQGTGRREGNEIVCRGRAIPGDRICHGREGRPRGRFEVFLIDPLHGRLGLSGPYAGSDGCLGQGRVDARQRMPARCMPPRP